MVIVILRIAPPTTTAVASAPVPSPVIVIVGVVVYPVPGFFTSMEVIPEYDCGISSNVTILSTPFMSYTLKEVDLNLLIIDYEVVT